MNEGIIERLEMVLSDMGLTRNAFSKSVGLGASNFNRKMKWLSPFTKRDFMLISNATVIGVHWNNS